MSLPKKLIARVLTTKTRNKITRASETPKQHKTTCHS